MPETRHAGAKTERAMLMAAMRRDGGGSGDVGKAAGQKAPTEPPKGVSGQYIGFGGMLKQWRNARGLNQGPVARALGISLRTYGSIERGATPKFDQAQCDALAAVLQLDADGRHALMLYSVGAYLRNSTAEGQPEVGPALRLLIDRQMPSPTYLSDRNWNILAYNQAMAEIWPWVMEPKANLIRWALTTEEGRATYHDWHKHARVFVRMLRFAQTTHGDDPDLLELIDDVKANPEIREIWDTDRDMVVHRDGHVFLATVPTLDYRTIEIVSHVAYPAIMPDCRFVVMTWVEADLDAKQDALGGARGAWADETHNAPHEKDLAQERISAAERHRAKGTRHARLVVNSAEEAAAQAGGGAVPLPALSRLLGRDAQLTLSPTKRSVVWAVAETPGRWGVTQVAPRTVIARIPRENWVGERRAEMKKLVRLALPLDHDSAVARIAQLLGDRDLEQGILREILAELFGSDCLPPEPKNSSCEAS
ncbi:helix-turn-helix domain-containing protein [Streptomyces sp. NPDC001828]|uniref:MmyB family transcriptional regulator n=1 Tax=Streptomyces sp. NPDC001828 TaxID=3364615 RepID=UPI0036CA0A37